LHWGNVLIQECSEDFKYALSDTKDIEVACVGLRATIIDYTLSRLDYRGTTFFLELKDDGIFDGKDDYQYDIYRMMRTEIGTDWEGFYPKTNVMVSQSYI
jgi:serine/threonine-protein kinase haspin